MQNEHTVAIRDMRPGEEKTLLDMARRAFSHSPMEQVAISKPKTALVAEVDGAIAGAMFIKVFAAAGAKTGYLDVGYVAKEYRGKGVGRVLYPAAVERLRAMGCRQIAALIIDDNAASWKPLQNMGFSTPSLSGLVRLLGIGPALSVWLRTFFCFAGGAQLWATGPKKERGSLQELASFLLVNLLLFVPGLLRAAGTPGLPVTRLLAYVAVLLVGVIFGGVGAALAGQSWRFGFPRGGALLPIICSAIGGVFPMVGRWYLKNPAPDEPSRRAMGVQATVEWLGLIALLAAYAVFRPGDSFVYQCASIAVNLLLFHVIPFMPFGAFGGARVYAWSKAAYALLAAASVALLFLVL